MRTVVFAATALFGGVVSTIIWLYIIVFKYEPKIQLEGGHVAKRAEALSGPWGQDVLSTSDQDESPEGDEAKGSQKELPGGPEEGLTELETAPDKFEDMARNLWKWAESHGSRFDGVAMQQLPGGERGIFTTRDVPKDHVMISLPLHLVITTRDAVTTPLGQAILRHVKAATEHVSYWNFDGLLLTAWLLHQWSSAASGYWGPYLASLPKSFPTMPLNFTESMLHQCVGGLKVERDILSFKKQIWETLKTIQSIPEAKNLTTTRFLKASFCAMSRGFTISRSHLFADTVVKEGLEHAQLPMVNDKWKLPDEAVIMVPVADLINHASDADVNADWNYRKSEFVIYARRAIPKGHELFITYGDKENSVWFSHYGFAEPGNPNDKVDVVLDFHKLAKERGLHYVNVPPPINFTLQRNAPLSQDVFNEILAACRAFSASRVKIKGDVYVEGGALQSLEQALVIEQRRYKCAVQASPMFCTTFCKAPLELLGILVSFVRSGLALLAAGSDGEGFVPDKSLQSEQAQLQAQAYFGHWFRRYGKTFVEDEEVYQIASDFGSILFSDVILFDHKSQ